MARHVYLILCRDVLHEEDTRMLSAIKVIERITVSDPDLAAKIAAAELSDKQIALVAHEMFCAAWFVRSDYDTPEVKEGRFAFRMPDGRVHAMVGGSLDFSAHTGVRFKLRLPGFPWGGFGLYWFVAQARQSETDEWVDLGAFPLEVVNGMESGAEERSEV